jgi:hypothetical protein
VLLIEFVGETARPPDSLELIVGVVDEVESSGDEEGERGKEWVNGDGSSTGELLEVCRVVLYYCRSIRD